MQQVQSETEQDVLTFYKSSFKSKHTAYGYVHYLKAYCTHYSHDLTALLGLDQKQAEDKLISFIIEKKQSGMTWGALHNYVAAVAKFYEINKDITLNLKRVNRFMPEQIRKRRDRAYSDEEIHKMVTLANERTKAIILLLASTGVRVGVLSTLKFGDLVEVDKGEVYKLTVYANTRSEYFTFCTPECKQALKSYFEIRERHGETISKHSPVIREQYDKRNPFAAMKAKHTSVHALSRILQAIMESAGLRPYTSANTTITNAGHSQLQHQEHEVMLAHGFRKFFNTQLANAQVNPLIKEMLMGHKVGLEASYYRPSEAQIYSEYFSKAVEALTIEPSMRLQRKVEKLEIERNEIQALALELEKIKRVTGVT